MNLTEEQVRALDLILGYLIETEEEDYEQQKADGNFLDDHLYQLALIVSKAYDTTA